MRAKRMGIILGVTICVASCAQSTPLPTIETTEVPTVILPTVIAPSTSPSPTSTPLPTSSANEGCEEKTGRMIETEFVNDELPRSIPYRIFIPPCVSEHYGHLPVVYLLHGLTRTDAQWDELQADEVAQELILTDQAPPFLIVMPWERLGLDYQQAIVEYLIPFIETEYGASPERDLRSIGGISRGAGWALRIGLQYPELFQAVGLHSPAVLVPDIYMLPDWIEAIPSESIPSVWIDIGDRDPLRLSLPELTAIFDEADLTYALYSYPGEHIEAYWEAHVEDYIRWYVSGWLHRELDDQLQ